MVACGMLMLVQVGEAEGAGDGEGVATSPTRVVEATAFVRLPISVEAVKAATSPVASNVWTPAESVVRATWVAF